MIWTKFKARLVATGLKKGLEEAQKRGQLRKEHIDTAKEYAHAVKNAATTTLKDVRNIVTGTTASENLQIYIFLGKEESEEMVKRDPGLDVPPANVNAYEVKKAVKETIQKGVETAKSTLKGAAQAVGEAMDPLATNKKAAASEEDQFTEELKQKGTKMKQIEEDNGLGGKN